ncbi:MAG: T9SS type A sorting domain-containing protein [Flavobacteriaceae bacterium]|nr:T9SS type A sorting domain-containing protein [Flavobacteriaceae bacterium]
MKNFNLINRANYLKSVVLLSLFGCFILPSTTTAQLKAQKNDNPPSKIKLVEQIAKNTKNDVEYVITSEHVSRTSGIHHIYVRQAVNGLEVYGTESSIHLNANGEIFKLNDNFVPELTNNTKSATPQLSAAGAVQAVAQQMGYNFQNLSQLKKEDDSEAYVFNSAGISGVDIPVKLMYYHRPNQSTALIWELSIQELDTSDWWNFRVDASSGNIIDKDNFTVYCFEDDHNHEELENTNAEIVEAPVFYTVENNSILVGAYNVFPMPIETPNHGSRSIVSNPEDLTASPYGWHDLNGAAGSETSNTSGNNCFAYDDDNNTNSGTPVNQSSAGLNFNFSFNPVYSAGTQSESAAVTNLFYWTNIIHDVVYQYGFDEVSGNFQENNYGNGGAAGDSVNSEAQDGSGTCNANFGTPSDGGNPRMQMYVCGSRDGDFDNGVIIHEYGHGISNRLTGGPAAAGCLGNQEQMGEGWSDYYGLLLTMESGDTRNDSRGIGTWLVGEGANGPGIRTYPYSTNFAVNPHTYNDITTEAVPHGVGSVWCAMLWEMTWDLIDQYGFDTDFYGGTGGNNISLNLVTEGMKLQPCSPGFVDGRDAIIAADAALYGGANECLIWEAFARRGLGYSASQGSSGSRADGTEAFDLPPGLGTPTLETISNVCISSGVQTGLGGGTPAGGVYSGIGVTDDGNGSTYTFDPSVNGVGTVVVTYTITNLCTGGSENDTDTIDVGDSNLVITCPGDVNTCYPDFTYEFPRPNDGCFGRSSNRVSQNTQEVVNNGIDCAGELSGHLRRFNLATEGVVRDYLVTGIDVGINSTTGANITVNLYLDANIPNAITTYTVPISGSVTPYASVTDAVPSGSSFVHEVPMNVFLPAGTAFTVEVISPATQDFMIGYNDSGVTNTPNDTQIGYTSCIGGLAYSDLSDFNLGANAVLIAVEGTESDFLTTVQTAGLPPNSTYPLGTTTNTFETTDSVSSNTVSCSFDVNVLGNSVTTYAGGTWSSGAPTSTAVAIFSDDYNTSGPGNSSIDACECEVDAARTVTVAAGDYLNVQQDITVNGSLIVEHTGNVVQTDDNAVVTNNGTINVQLTTPNLDSRDFMIMGSPMDLETRGGIWSSAFLVLDHQTGNFVPNAAVEAAFPGAENFADDNYDNWVPMNLPDPLNPGEGFLVRPQSGYGQPGGVFNYTYGASGGTLNNGQVNFSVLYNTPGPTAADNKNASPNVLANPYPSAIWANDFISANPMVDEVFFWEHLTPPSPSLPGAGSMNFSMEDISMYNLGGGTAAGNPPVPSTEPNGFISTGQGFGIKATAAGTAVFNNSMRRTTNNNTLRDQDKERIWLKLIDTQYEMGSTTLIGFNESATAGLDSGYDSRRLAKIVSIYSHLEDGSQQLGIQTREAFETGAQVPLGYSTQMDANLSYKISISKLEGENLENANVYLIDNLTGDIHNLNDGAYSFTSDKGTFHNRFMLQFEVEEILGPGENALSSVLIYPNPASDELTIVSPNAFINNVEIYDIRGRRMQQPVPNGKNTCKMDVNNLETAVYFVKVITDSGTITKKMIKK